MRLNFVSLKKRSITRRTEDVNNSAHLLGEVRRRPGSVDGAQVELVLVHSQAEVPEDDVRLRLRGDAEDCRRRWSVTIENRVKTF